MLLSSGDIGASERHARIILGSYYKLLGSPLLALDTAAPAAPQLFESPVVVLSHGTEADPVLNYGNKAALELWEMDWPTFIRTPSRETAEPLIQADREIFLQAVASKGYMDGYTGIRISSGGRRFRIQDVIVWNLRDESGKYVGQAAAFTRYAYV
jgi:hypothetical protein